MGKKKTEIKKLTREELVKLYEEKPTLENKLFLNYFDKTKYRAIIYNSNGEQVASVNLDRSKNTFNYKDKSYIIEWDFKSYFKRSDLLFKYKYFHYDIDDPMPIDIRITEKRAFNSTLFNNMLETKVVKDLNNVNNTLASFLTPKNILIGLGVIAAVYYFGTGGTLA